MNSWVVVDSNIFLATVIPDNQAQKAHDLIEFIEEEGLKIMIHNIWQLLSILDVIFGQ